MQRLSDYPSAVVNVSCSLCPRRGRYKLARLAARYGADASLDDVLARLAGNCRSWHPNPRRYDPRCGARFEDIDRMPVPDVAAGGPLHRVREIPREDIPQPSRPAAAVPPLGDARLSGWTAPRIAVVCDACHRREAFDTATVRAATVADVRLGELLRSLAARCPRLRPGGAGDPCRARLEPDG